MRPYGMIHIWLISLMMLPLPCLLSSVIDIHQVLPSPTNHSQASAGRDMYQYLLDIAAAEEEIQDLIWNPLGPYLSPSSAERTSFFLERLSQWRARSSMAFSSYIECLSPPTNLTYQTIDEYTLPPHPLPDIPHDTCLTLALYTFYIARLFWALSLFNPSNSSHELNSYVYLYQHLRLVATSM
ncbi:hypothetical protein BJX65DRAFT_93995 [Aspergillus insuetus]